MNINAVAAQGPVQSAAPVARSGSIETVAAPTAPVKPDRSKPEQVKDAAQQIEQFTQNIAQNLKFSVDEDTGKTVVKIVDSQTQEIIRQIPSEEAISIARTLDKVQGLLLNGKA
ncbi:flagellar biosynthesis protein FlaG [Nitrosomonas sp. JL21]|uniref:flagellar protein FlaG n=1 Tax=Nitrosomonas sp. JL21 TaxID=153949 RepID=UPI00136B0362|nr:flagellar protein FlaG [Nitrosomonas sp. JL21]MBL8497611.1 flagellar protein FlaG [Nitrosomonas sp.]MCC7090660.1 flagellar protein FlaG [Nitrosomonas sp.]MXS77792.1 flagellar biosynthesis protein FlaG [Nitrosomonas sp. JL21]